MTKACYSVKELTNQVVLGDAYSELVKFPDACVDAVVTSPPYYSQRDYENGVQIGTEGSIEKYLERLFCVFPECRRILKPSGCLWPNIGDKYLNGNLASLPWRLAIQLQDKGKEPLNNSGIEPEAFQMQLIRMSRVSFGAEESRRNDVQGVERGFLHPWKHIPGIFSMHPTQPHAITPSSPSPC